MVACHDTRRPAVKQRWEPSSASKVQLLDPRRQRGGLDPEQRCSTLGSVDPPVGLPKGAQQVVATPASHLGVGNHADLAKALGAKVATTVRSQEDADFARSLGADFAIKRARMTSSHA